MTKKITSETEKLEKQFDEFNQNVKDLTQDRMNAAPVEETEPQTKLSSQEIANSKDRYLKPTKSIGVNQPFNEKWREGYNFDKEYVHFIAEHKEIIGDNIEIWTHPYPGMPAEYWEVPTNTPIWGPRYLAEQIKRKRYHRLKMEQRSTHSDHGGQWYGALAVDTTVQRLDAQKVNTNRQIAMKVSNF